MPRSRLPGTGVRGRRLPPPTGTLRSARSSSQTRAPVAVGSVHVWLKPGEMSRLLLSVRAISLHKKGADNNAHVQVVGHAHMTPATHMDTEHVWGKRGDPPGDVVAGQHAVLCRRDNHVAVQLHQRVPDWAPISTAPQVSWVRGGQIHCTCHDLWAESVRTPPVSMLTNRHTHGHHTVTKQSPSSH